MSESKLKKAYELIKNDDPRPAVPLLVEYLKSHPDSEQGWLLLGIASPKADKKIRCFNRVLEINPNNEKALKELNQLKQASKKPTPKRSNEIQKNAIDEEKSQPDYIQMVTIVAPTLIVVIAIIAGIGWLQKRNRSPVNPVDQTSEQTNIPEAEAGGLIWETVSAQRGVPPDIVSHIDFTVPAVSGSAVSPCDRVYYEDENWIAAGDVQAWHLGEPVESNGAVVTADMFVLPLETRHHLEAQVAICASQAFGANTVSALAPNGEALQPFLTIVETDLFSPIPDQDGFYSGADAMVYGAHLPLEAFSRPGSWRLVVDSPQRFEIEIQVPEPDEPFLLQADLDILAGGLETSEQVVIIAYAQFEPEGDLEYAELRLQANPDGYLFATVDNVQALFVRRMISESGSVLSEFGTIPDFIEASPALVPENVTFDLSLIPWESYEPLLYEAYWGAGEILNIIPAPILTPPAPILPFEPPPIEVDASTDIYEPNDSFDTAAGPLEDGSSVQGFISDSEDSDVFLIEVSGPATVQILLWNIPEDADYDLWVMTATGELFGGSTNSGIENEFVVFETDGSEPLYILVLSFDGASSRSQPYVLTVKID